MEISENLLKKLNKIKDTINLILAMFITLSPIFAIVVNALDKELYIHNLFKWFGWMYLVFLPYLIICICLQKGFWMRICEKLKKLPVILALALYGWIIFSCMVTNTFNVFFLYFVVYICIFICIIMLDEKYESLIVNTLICTMAISCLLGILDPTGRFLPGFDSKSYPLSLQFYNPNYTGYVMGLVSILNTWILSTTKSKKQLIISIFAFVLLNMHLFMNGSFAPITFVFFTLFLMILFSWIKDKKCPVKLIICLIAMLPMIFLVDLIPNINKYRTCQYNYFLECIAVLDNNLGTDMLSWFGISEIIGADGWDRGELQAAAWAEILGSFSTFLFGNGSGGNFQFKPHNIFLCLWLNYGIIAVLLYSAIHIYLIIRFFKLKNNTHLLGYMGAVVGYFLMMLTGDLIEYSFCFNMIILAITFRKIEHAHTIEQKEARDKKIEEYLEQRASRKKSNKKSTTTTSNKSNLRTKSNQKDASTTQVKSKTKTTTKRKSSVEIEDDSIDDIDPIVREVDHSAIPK